MIKCFHNAADSKFDDAYTHTLCLFLLASLLVFSLFYLYQQLADVKGYLRKILIIVYVNNFSGLNVVLQMSEYFCHATFRHSSVYYLILRKVCAINK